MTVVSAAETVKETALTVLFRWLTPRKKRTIFGAGCYLMLIKRQRKATQRQETR